jgi:hypothetical protein
MGVSTYRYAQGIEKPAEKDPRAAGVSAGSETGQLRLLNERRESKNVSMELM